MQARILLLTAVLLALPAAAHGEHEVDCDRRADTWTHLRLWEPELDAGEAQERVLAFEGCPLEEGWRFLLRGDVEGELRVTLHQGDDLLGNWSWTGDGHFEAVTLPHTEFLRLRLENVGAGNASARLYFDQTCLCTAKGTRLVPGPVWMNALAEEGDRVSFNVTVMLSGNAPDLPETVRVRAVGPEATREWTFHTGNASCNEVGPWAACLEYAFTAPASGRQDVLLWLDHDGDEAWSLAVRPVVEVQGPQVGAPGLGPLALVAVLALATLRRR